MAISLARKNLFAEKTRLLISVGGVAFSVLLILVLLSLYQGWQTLIASYVNGVKADVWVMQEGTVDMFHSVTLIPITFRENLKEMDGVGEVYRLLMRRVSIELGGKDVDLQLIGYDTVSGRGGPSRVVSGSDSPGRGEIILDRVFTNSNSLKLNDEIVVSGRNFKIVGISEGGNFIVTQTGFIPIEDAEELLEMQIFANYFLVSVKEGFGAEGVIQTIEANSDLDARGRAEFLEDNQGLVTETFLPIIEVLVLIGFAVGVAIVGLTVYTATIEKSREYGILKAIGAGNTYLYQTIFEQSLISSLLGFAVGVALTYAVDSAAGALVPEFVTVIRPVDIALVLGVAVLMSIFASFIPIKRIAGLDPMLVFKS